MPRKKQHYGEGDWFALPLKEGGFALGLIARMNGPILFGYFFGPRRPTLPTLNDAAELEASGAIECKFFGDLDLLNREWKVLGPLPNWDRSRWPLSSFAHKDAVSGRYYVRTYDENTLDFLSERPATQDEVSGLPADGLAGSGAVVSWISKLIQHKESR